MRTRPSSAAIGFLFATLVALGGCGDPLRPELRGATLRIYLGSTAFDEQTVAVGSVFQLVANIFDAAGKKIEGETVEWSSDRPDVAIVDDAGVVTAKAVGTAHIVARHEIGEDRVRLNVAEALAPNALPGCGGVADLSLAAGEVKVVPGNEALPLCLPGGASGAEYAIIAVNTGTTAASTLQLQVDAVGVAASVGSRSGEVRADLRSPLPTAAERFHDRLRRDISARLEPRLRAGIDQGAFALRMQSTLGETLSLNVAATGDGCSDVKMRGGRVRAISDRAIIVADTLNPADGYTTDDYKDFGDFFDDDVWPLVTANFGDPSDIDSSGKVIIFFTRAVNDLAANSGAGSSYVGGFFFNRDLFPESTCGGSNEAEMFYMLVPNPSPSSSNERRFPKSFVDRSTRNVLVHEFQHLVNDSRRLHVNKAPVWEETWLNEGLSHIAEELMFYRDSGLSPGENLDSADFSTSQSRESYRLFQLDNQERFTQFLQRPEYSSLMGADLLATRGAAWAFLRYAADRRGGDERQLWHELVKEVDTAGLANLRDALAGDPMAWVGDWAAALYLDDARVSSDARYQMASWNFRDLYPVTALLWPGATPTSVYPLHVNRLYSGVPLTLPLKGGGAGYLTLEVKAGDRGAVRFVTGGQALLPAPGRLKVVVVRRR